MYKKELYEHVHIVFGDEDRRIGNVPLSPLVLLLLLDTTQQRQLRDPSWRGRMACFAYII